MDRQAYRVHGHSVILKVLLNKNVAAMATETVKMSYKMQYPGFCNNSMSMNASFYLTFLNMWVDRHIDERSYFSKVR